MKVLIIRFSSIGDIVLTTPIIRCVKMQLPLGSTVHYLCKPNYSSLLDKNTNIDKLWLLKPKVSATIKDLRAQKFDCIIDLQNNFRSLVIKRFCGVKAYSFDKLNIRKFLLTQFHLNTLPNKHIVDRYFETVHKLGIKNDNLGLDFFNASEKEHIIEKTGLDANLSFIAIAIGGQHNTKKMPWQKLAEMISKIPQKCVLLGGPEDKDIGDKLFEVLPSKVLNLCGQLSLNESAGVVALSNAVITHDTGMMHISAALKKPILVLWGNTIPHFGMGPYYGRDKIFSFNSEVPNLKCRPCHKLGYSDCPKGHFNCMNLQNTENLIKALAIASV